MSLLVVVGVVEVGGFEVVLTSTPPFTNRGLGARAKQPGWTHARAEFRNRRRRIHGRRQALTLDNVLTGSGDFECRHRRRRTG